MILAWEKCILVSRGLSPHKAAPHKAWVRVGISVLNLQRG